MPEDRSVDLFYPAANRLEFTRETFTALVANTDWRFVRELVVYDDGSEDGACEWLEENVPKAPAPARLLRTRFGSPVAAMLHFIESAQAPVLAKCDNDAVYPPGWLRLSLDVLDRHPELSLLGLEALYPHSEDLGLPRSYAPAEFISGLGLYRREAFERSRPQAFNKYYGLEEWQMAQGPALVRGWITPALPVFLLDRCAFPPWSACSERYERCGWQRPWQRYSPGCTLWRWRWPELAPGGTVPGFRLNFAWCDALPPGFVNLDVVPGASAKGCVDFTQPWPLAGDSAEFVRAWDFVEHLPDKTHTMNELWRILQAGARAEIAVPTTEGTGAWQDPTHVSFWNRRSFCYFEAGNPYRERFARHYGITARFRVVEERTETTVDGPRLVILLEAVKP